MLKTPNNQIVFLEFPREISLAFNISSCPHRCPGCHSNYLWEDVGEELNYDLVNSLLRKNRGAISCVGFMGGDNDVESLRKLIKEVKAYHSIKIGWYTGYDIDTVNKLYPDWKNDLNYLKYGPYIERLGPLNSPTSNQHMLGKDLDGGWKDISYFYLNMIKI